ncbi:TPA: RNA-dependent DNA polymerase, partial [Staphylococcus aureus]|nr:RNA-dependent DNA polymerase [Staphylococcus aureus]
LTNKFINFTEQLIDLKISKEKLKKIARQYFKENKEIWKGNLDYYILNGWNQEVYQILLYSVLFDEEKILNKKSLQLILKNDLDDYSKCLSVILWIKKKFSFKVLLNTLEDKLKEVHSSYNDDASVRMQEKYWLLRYFIFYINKNNIIDDAFFKKHYNENNIKKDRNNIIKSELNMHYVLKSDSRKKQYVNRVNEFFGFLLNNNVALIQTNYNHKLFEYL